MKTNPSKNEERAAIELLRQTRVDVRLEDGAIVIAPQHSDVYCEAPLWMARMRGRITFRDWNAFGEMTGRSFDILPSRIEQSGRSGVELRSEAEGGYETGAVELEGMRL